MPLFNRFTAVVMAVAMLAPMLPLEAKTRKGDKFYQEGKVHEAKKEWDAALESYQKALQEDPAEILYEISCDRARFEAAQLHVDLALKIRAQGRLGDALLELQKAYAINPGSVIAGQELIATNNMILRERQRVEQTGKESPPEIRALTPYQEALRRDNERFSRILGLPELRPLDNSPIDWHLSGQKTKKVFIAIGKIAGINVLFDPEFTEPTADIPVDLQHATVQEALDNVCIVTKSYWKAINANTIFIFNDNQNKRRDYEDLVTKVIYLQNATLPAELQEIQQILRTACDINRVFPYNSGFALVVRGEADRVELCQKLIRDIDKPKPEVLVDILVMDASTTFSKQLAATIASGGLNIPGTFTPRAGLQVQSSTASTSSTTTGVSTSTGTTSTTSTTPTTSSTSGTSTSSTTGTMIPLANLGHLSSADFATTLPSALLQAVMSDTRSKVLQAPQLRAVDNVKAIMNIGERVPVASGSFQPGVGGIGINPLVNTQFNYQDVGVNVEMTARVLEGNEVYMHLKIDVSEIDGYQSQGGINEPIIGQRKIEQELRVKEGEVALIGGVIKQQDDLTITGVPGLSKIPLLGTLFSGKSMDHSSDDLMIVMIPHVIRRQEYTEENLREVGVGNQTLITLRHAPPATPFHVDGQIPEADARVNYLPADGPMPATPAAAPSSSPAGGPRTSQEPPTPLSVVPAPTNAPASTIPAGPQIMQGSPPAAAQPALAPPATAPPGSTPPPTGPVVPGTAPATVPAVGGEGDARGARVKFNPSRMEVRLSSPVAVSVVIESATDVSSAPLTIRFDPKMLHLNDVTAGNFLAADGQTPVLTKNIQNETGMATVTINRPPGVPGVSGPGGVLLNLNFQTVARGSTTVTIPNASVRNSQGQPVGGGNPELTLTIQ